MPQASSRVVANWLQLVVVTRAIERYSLVLQSAQNALSPTEPLCGQAFEFVCFGGAMPVTIQFIGMS